MHHDYRRTWCRKKPNRQSSGFDESSGVRVGRFVELELEGSDRAVAEQRLGEMCEKLLANLVVEDYRFELEEAE